MPMFQSQLIQASEYYRDSLNQEHMPGNRLRLLEKKRLFINHAPEDFRLVEGLFVLMQKAGLDCYFDWDSGSRPGTSRHTRLLQIHDRLMAADVVFIVASANYRSVPYCQEDLAIAENLKKKIYLVSTSTEDTVFGTEFSGVYSELTVHRTVQGRFVVRVLDIDRKNLWRTISTVDIL